MTPTTPTPPATDATAIPTKLDNILSFLTVGAQWAALLPLPGSAAASKIAGSLLKIIQAAVKTHEAVTGQPLDLDKLHELPPLE